MVIGDIDYSHSMKNISSTNCLNIMVNITSHILSQHACVMFVQICVIGRMMFLVRSSCLTAESLNRRSSSYVEQNPKREISVINRDVPQTLSIDTAKATGNGNNEVRGLAHCTMDWPLAFTFVVELINSWRKTLNRFGIQFSLLGSDKLLVTSSNEGYASVEIGKSRMPAAIILPASLIILLLSSTVSDFLSAYHLSLNRWLHISFIQTTFALPSTAATTIWLLYFCCNLNLSC